jgi:hypothetical protein
MPTEQKPSPSQLALSHAARLRRMAATAQRAWDRACHQGKVDSARTKLQEMRSLEAGADALEMAAKMMEVRS